MIFEFSNLALNAVHIVSVNINEKPKAPYFEVRTVRSDSSYIFTYDSEAARDRGYKEFVNLWENALHGIKLKDSADAANLKNL